MYNVYSFNTASNKPRHDGLYDVLPQKLAAGMNLLLRRELKRL